MLLDIDRVVWRNLHLIIIITDDVRITPLSYIPAWRRNGLWERWQTVWGRKKRKQLNELICNWTDFSLFSIQCKTCSQSLAHLFSGSLCRQSSTKAWKCGENVRLYGWPAEEEEGSPLEWRAPPAPGPSQIPESAPERDGFMDSSSGGIVVVSSKHGTVPLSFSSSICGHEEVSRSQTGYVTHVPNKHMQAGVNLLMYCYENRNHPCAPGGLLSLSLHTNT